MTARHAEEDRMLAKVRAADDGELVSILEALLDDGLTRREIIAFAQENSAPGTLIHRVIMCLDALIRERRGAALP